MIADLEILQRCLSGSYSLYFDEKCMPYVAEVSPSELETSLTDLGDIAADAGPDSIGGWFFEFNRYVMSSNEFDAIPKAAQDLRSSLLKQKTSLTGHGTNPIAARLEHVVDVAIASATLVDEAWREGQSPDTVLSSFTALRNLIHADGKVDGDESLVVDILDAYTGPFNRLGGTAELLHLAKTEISTLHPMKEPAFIADGHPLYINLGADRTPSCEDVNNIPESYRIVPEDDARLRSMITDSQCFSFALSARVRSDTEAAKIIAADYEPVDLRTHRAKPGDIVLYTTPSDKDHKSLEDGSYDALSHFHHLAVVSKVDRKGFPTKVMSKLGDIKPIYEHPVDEALLIYGVMWTVYRKK